MTNPHAAHSDVCPCNECSLRRALERMEERAQKAEQQLVLLGERAVVVFDDAVVGAVDSAVPDGVRYKDWLKDVMGRANRTSKAEAERDEAYSTLSKMKKELDWWKENGQIEVD